MNREDVKTAAAGIAALLFFALMVALPFIWPVVTH